MDKELEKKLTKTKGISDLEVIIAEYSLVEDVKKLKEILSYIKENPKKKNILGHSLQNLTRQDIIPVKSIKQILKGDIDSKNLNVALQNLSKASLKSELRTKAVSLIKFILKNNPSLSKDVKTFHKCCFNGVHQVVSAYLENGADGIIDEIHDNNTALLNAIRSKDLKKVKKLVEGGADINLKKKNLKKPIDYAVEKKADKIAQYLKSQGEKLSSDGKLTVFDMVLNDRHDLLEKLVKEGKNKDIHNALSFAINENKVKSAKVILKDEDYEFEPKELGKALYYTCHALKGKDRIKLAKMLIERGADIEAEIDNNPVIELLQECSDIVDLLKKSSLFKEIDDSEQLISEASYDLCEILLNSITNEKRKTLRFSLAKSIGDKNPWDSGFGGKPYFTKGMKYPLLKSGKPMPFLGQINFEDLPGGLFSDQPKTGLLQIYIDSLNSKEEKYIFIKKIVKDKSKVIVPPEFKPLLKNIYAIEPEKKLTETNPFPKDIRYSELYKRISGIVLGDYDGDQLREIEEQVFKFMTEQENNSGNHMGGFAFFSKEDPRSGNKKGFINLIQIDEHGGNGDSSFFKKSGLGHIFVKPDAFKTLDFSDSFFHFDSY